MLNPTEDQARAICPTCGVGHLRPTLIDDAFEFGSEDGPVQVEARGVPVEECPECGETLSGPEAGRIRHAAICRTLGLLAPDEIKAMREGLKLTQAEFGRLTGIGEATISRWERGRLIQNRAHDRYLRLLIASEANVEFLSRLPAKAMA